MIEYQTGAIFLSVGFLIGLWWARFCNRPRPSALVPAESPRAVEVCLFLSENCRVVASSEKVQTAEVFDAYSMWASPKVSGMSWREFSLELRRRGFQFTSDGRHRYVVGLSLLDEARRRA